MLQASHKRDTALMKVYQQHGLSGHATFVSVRAQYARLELDSC